MPVVPATCCPTCSHRTFPAVGARAWNVLPLAIRVAIIIYFTEDRQLHCYSMNRARVVKVYRGTERPLALTTAIQLNTNTQTTRRRSWECISPPRKLLKTPPFGKIFGVMSGLSLGTRVSNLKSVALTVLELLAFNSHRSTVHTHTNTQTDIERTRYLRHSLRSLGGDNKVTVL